MWRRFRSGDQLPHSRQAPIPRFSRREKQEGETVEHHHHRRRRCRLCGRGFLFCCWEKRTAQVQERGGEWFLLFCSFFFNERTSHVGSDFPRTFRGKFSLRAGCDTSVAPGTPMYRENLISWRIFYRPTIGSSVTPLSGIVKAPRGSTGRSIYDWQALGVILRTGTYVVQNTPRHENAFFFLPIGINRPHESPF